MEYAKRTGCVIDTTCDAWLISMDDAWYHGFRVVAVVRDSVIMERVDEPASHKYKRKNGKSPISASKPAESDIVDKYSKYWGEGSPVDPTPVGKVRA